MFSLVRAAPVATQQRGKRVFTALSNSGTVGNGDIYAIRAKELSMKQV
jgi:hypothetical protein